MKDIERKLKEQKEEYDLIKAPEEMKARLNEAISKTGRRRPKYSALAASLLVVFMLAAYSFDAIAYYGKRFTGYEQITEAGLKELNEKGRGQKIDKTCTFSNNVSVTIDGIMFDENELIVFYKVINPTGKLDFNTPRINLTGLKPTGYMPEGGHGYMKDEHTIIQIDTFEPPQFYEKWMSFEIHYIINGRIEKKKIDFTLNRNLAMKQVIKKDIDTSVSADDYEVNFDTITASAMSTVINGTITPLKNEESIPAKAKEDMFEGLEKPRIVFDLFADNKPVENFGGSQGQSMNTRTFSAKFDALPENFSSLKVDNIRFETMKLTNTDIDISMETEDLRVNDDLVIRKIETVDNSTHVTISSSGIPVVGLFSDNKQLDCTNYNSLKYKPAHQSPVDRTFKFEGTGKKLNLKIKFIRYSDYTDEVVDIPVK